MNKELRPYEATFEEVQLGEQDFVHYQEVTPRIYKETKAIAKKLERSTVIHVNSTEKGGGVAEMLKTHIPLERSLGLDSHWYVIHAEPDFYEVTKKVHNSLQGSEDTLSDKEKHIYRSTNESLGMKFAALLENYDDAYIVIHDPQPMALIEYIPEEHLACLRLHIDLSTPNAATLDFFKPYIMQYPYTIVSSSLYRPAWLPLKETVIMYPAIDPFTEKNKPMELEAAKVILENYGINPEKPILAQVSRFDPWKDPIGVINAFYNAKNSVPDLQLILAGFFQAKDDPEAIRMFETVKKHGEGDPDIHMFEDLETLKDISNDTFVSAIYTASTVMMQKSLREGFGLTVTEAMWKGKPVVGGDTTGIRIQIQPEKNGFIVGSVEEAARATVTLLQDADLRERIGKAAHESVKENFLLSRVVKQHLEVYRGLESAEHPAPALES